MHLIELERTSQELSAASLARPQCMIAIDPGFTITTRMPPYRDVAFRQELHAALQSFSLPE